MMIFQPKDHLTAGRQVIEKAKLDAHILDIASYHEALVPWRRPHSAELVLVRSSLPLEQRVMHDRSPQNAAQPAPSRFACFTRSAKARLLQDLKTLPRQQQDDAALIHRTNTSFYEDERAGQVLLVYAPDGCERLEFVHMTLLPPH